MSEHGRLTSAAKLLRERAEEIHDGPWDHVVGACGDHSWVERRNIETIVETRDIGTSAYIAMMHPPVAKALADWLDLAADDHDAGCPSDCPATRVVDAILGGDR